MEIDSCPLCLYVLQSKATLLLLLLLLSRYLFTSPSLYHAISKLLCCFVSMCLDGEFAVFLFVLHCFVLFWAKQSNARQDKAKQYASSVTANISHTNCHLVRYLLPTSRQSQRITLCHLVRYLLQFSSLPYIALLCFAQSKAKQCRLCLSLHWRWAGPAAACGDGQVPHGRRHGFRCLGSHRTYPQSRRSDLVNLSISI